MMEDTPETSSSAEKFDFPSFPEDTLFHERRDRVDRRTNFKTKSDDNTNTTPRAPKERRVKKERRRRIDPTTFEKQYTEDELEFMNAMQRFKVQECKSFPTHGEVLRVAQALGYRKVVPPIGSHADGHNHAASNAAAEEGSRVDLSDGPMH